jgi:hypothetical protein
MRLVNNKTILSIAALAIAFASSTAPAFCQNRPAAKNSLPPCNLDSFVYQAGAQAEMIYGDEGVTDIPPLFGFTSASRISAGITGINDAGLTTGHGSYMPSAAGADEFIAGPDGEWAQSGVNHGNLNYNNAAALLDATDLASAADPAAAASQATAMDQAAMDLLNQSNQSSPFYPAADDSN